jgi:hypothetical protein
MLYENLSQAIPNIPNFGKQLPFISKIRTFKKKGLCGCTSDKTSDAIAWVTTQADFWLNPKQKYSFSWMVATIQNSDPGS